MATLRENALRIKAAKEEIRQSIINKGVEISEELKIEEYSSKIDSISTGPETGTYSVEVYIRVDNELIGENVNFIVVGTDGTSTTATSRNGGYLFLTLNYNVGYDVQPVEEDKYYAENHTLIYHVKNEGNYFATDYYFTTAQTGGGSEEWEPITNWDYVFYNTALMNNAKYILPHLKNPTSISNFAVLKNTIYYPESYEIINLLKTNDFSTITSALNSFQNIVFPIKTEEIQEMNFKIDFSKSTNVSYFLSGFNYPSSHSADTYKKIQKINLTVDFDGTTENVTNFSYLLRNTTSYTLSELHVLNLNMQKCTNSSGAFSCLSNAPTLRRLTFKGSFGGLSTTTSLTIDLSAQGALTAEAFLETMTTISENTNGKTRIFKLPAALYDSLTDDILDLADEKGYTLSS